MKPPPRRRSKPQRYQRTSGPEVSQRQVSAGGQTRQRAHTVLFISSNTQETIWFVFRWIKGVAVLSSRFHTQIVEYKQKTFCLICLIYAPHPDTLSFARLQVQQAQRLFTHHCLPLWSAEREVVTPATAAADARGKQQTVPQFSRLLVFRRQTLLTAQTFSILFWANITERVCSKSISSFCW